MVKEKRCTACQRPFYIGDTPVRGMHQECAAKELKKHFIRNDLKKGIILLIATLATIFIITQIIS